MAKHIEGHPFVVGSDLSDILAEADISASAGKVRLAAGTTFKVLCPACRGGTTRERSLSVTIDADGQGAAWKCHRANCSGNALIPGAGRIEGADRPHRGDRAPEHAPRPAPVPPKLDPPEVLENRPAEMMEWFMRRGISTETVAAFGIYARRHFFPQASAEKLAIVFPYQWRATTVNRKFRSLEKDFAQDKGTLRSLFNADALESDDIAIIVEGEMDVLACWEAGLRQVFSLPDGAPGKLHDEDDPARRGDRRYEALTTCADVLAPVKKIIIATDMDVPGTYLAEELARRLGRGRCWRVTWPKGCKDANDVLLRLGAAALMAAVEAAEPWPLAGIASMPHGALAEYRRQNLAPRGLESGIAVLDAVARLPAGGGWLTVLTGVPSHGKSTLLRAWLVQLADRHDLGIVYASPEDNRPENLALDLAALWTGSPWRAGPAQMAMPDDELTDAEGWVREHFTFIASNDPDVEMTIPWVLARAEEAKKRHARHLLVLDPWNEFEHDFDQRRETETQYIGRTLRKLKAWGRAEGMGIVIAAHPRIMQPDQQTKKYPVANGYDIAGSANWFNRTDLGLTAYRRTEGFIEAHCWKARFQAFGVKDGKADLKLNPTTGRLSSTGGAQPDSKPAPAPW